MKAYLNILLKPWEQRDPLTRVCCCVSSAVMVLSLIMLFTSKVTMLLFAALFIFIPLVAVSMVKNWRETKKDLQRVDRLKHAFAVEDGSVRMDELPGHIQEDIRLERARYRLDKDN